MSTQNYKEKNVMQFSSDRGLPTLTFKNNEAKEEEGLGHAGIETYADTPCSSVARECGQNSNDVFLRRPVKLSFRLLDVESHDFPSLDKFVSAVNACRKIASDEKEIDFFDRAKRILEGDTISILEISDFNTKGAKGPCVKGNPFHALVKGKGVNVKENEDSGGSFGIGKNAAFAVSDLQTVFYSTLYLDENIEERFLAQGKSILTSHEDEKGKPKEATGYWGRPNYEPIEKKQDVPEWMRREEVGTSIFAVGFSQDDWQSLMKASVVANFFVAIHRGEIVFEIDGEEIDKNNISKIFHDEELLKKIKGGYLEESFRFSSCLYKCLTSPKAIKKQLYIENMGRISIMLLQQDNFPKRIGIIRNGMYITDTLKNFGEPLSHFPNQENFVAMIEPIERHGSTYLKKLENPSHDGFSAERIKDPEKKKLSKKAIKTLVKKARDMIKEDTYIEAEESIDLDEMQEFFPRASDEDDLRDPKSDEEDLSTVKFKARKSKRRPTKKITNTKKEGEEGGASGSGQSEENGNGGGSGSGKGAGRNGKGSHGQSIPVDLDELRNLIPDNSSAYYREIFFTPNHTGEISLSVSASGIDEEVELAVTEIDGRKVRNKSSNVFVEAGRRNQISIKFAELYDGPIKVSALTQTEQEEENEVR